MALGLDNFSGTVGGNVSGTSDLAPLDQQADMIVEWMPEVKKVGLLYCSAEANSQYQVDEVQKYLEAKGVTATQYAFSDSNDLSSVCQKAADENDALYVPTDNTVAANTGIVDGVCRPAKKLCSPVRRASAPAAAWPPCPSATTIWATPPVRWQSRS